MVLALYDGHEIGLVQPLKSRDDGLDDCIERLVLALFAIEGERNLPKLVLLV